MINSIHLELEALVEADRRERQNHLPYDTPEYWAMQQRDTQRRERAQEIVAANPNLSAADLYLAALVLQHGGNLDEVGQAHRLAQHAAALGYQPARWLAAAAYDRWLMYQGRPQKYGTQIVPDGQRYRVWEVDPATTDAERREWHVRPLSQQHDHAAELTRVYPQPPPERAPAWLKAAIERWQTKIAD